MLKRRQVILTALASLLNIGIGPGALADSGKADRVLVLKKDRTLLLLKSGNTLRAYAIRLGANPEGPKIFQWDGRTPEGEFRIDRRTLNTPFHRALHISYPGPENVARAARYGLPPGGGIYIHGTPNTGTKFERDWTDGCIAVSNQAVAEIWKLVDDGTTIEIRP